MSDYAKPSTKYTFVTSNMLLGADFIGKIQNTPNVHRRLIGAADSLAMNEARAAMQNCKILENASLSSKERRKTAKLILQDWPLGVDFICLQEVWDRMSALVLMYKMRERFPHFLADVCQDLGSSNHVYRSKYMLTCSEGNLVIVLSL